MSKASDKPEQPALAAEMKSALPFAESCRARSLWSINEYAECLVALPEDCEYAIKAGNHYYCHHPQRQEIVTRTLKIIRGMTT